MSHEKGLGRAQILCYNPLPIQNSFKKLNHLESCGDFLKIEEQF